MARIPPLCLALIALALAACTGPERRPQPFPGDPLPGTADDRSTLAVDAEMFLGYANTERTVGDESERLDAFFVDRAELGAGYLAGSGLGAELRLEAVRTAEPGSYTGVVGNSLVMRVRRARGFYTGEIGDVGLDVELGLVTDPWLAALLPRFHLRATGPLLAESAGVFDANELGAKVGLRFWDDRIELAVGVLNGEGRAEEELNDEKDLTVRLSLELPVAEMGGAPLAVGVHGVYRRGRVGPGADPARNDRFGGALTLTHPDYGLGAMWIRAEGFAGRGDDQAEAIEVWADARLVAEWLGVAVRGWQLDRKPEDGEVITRRLLGGGLFADLDALLPGLARSRLYLLYDTAYADAAAASVPGAAEEIRGVRLVFEVAGGRRF